jgi:hypothetical protein
MQKQILEALFALAKKIADTAPGQVLNEGDRRLMMFVIGIACGALVERKRTEEAEDDARVADGR